MPAETSGMGIWRGLVRPHGWGATATPHDRNTSTNAPWTMVSITPRWAATPGPVARRGLFRSTEFETLGREAALVSPTPGAPDRRVLLRSLARGSPPGSGRVVVFKEPQEAACHSAVWAAGMWCWFPREIFQRYQ